jgi:hypothetical protein
MTLYSPTGTAQDELWEQPQRRRAQFAIANLAADKLNSQPTKKESQNSNHDLFERKRAAAAAMAESTLVLGKVRESGK